MAASSSGNVTSGEIRVVGWINREEWEYLYRSLYSDDVNLKKKSLERLAAWRCRFVSKIPVAVDSTASLVNAVIQDELKTTDTATLSFIYSMALIRFVNMITDKAQTKQYAKPVHTVAEELGLPEWLVNLRHEATHTELPSLRVLRTGVRYALSWLQLEYWEENSEVVTSDDNDEIRDILINYQQEQFKKLEAQKLGFKNKDVKAAKSAVNVLKDVLRSRRRTCLIQTMLQDGFLVPSEEQLQSLQISEDDFVRDSGFFEIPSPLFTLWSPLLQLFQQLDITYLLIDSLLTELCKFTNQDVFAARCLAGWLLSLVTSVRNKSYKSEVITSDTLRNINWKNIFNLCVENPGRGTLSLMTRIMSHMKPPIPKTTRQQIKELVSVYLSSDQNENQPELTEKSIYTIEDIAQEVKGHHGVTKVNGNHSANAEMPAKDDNDGGWQLCRDPVDWSMYPLGMIPNQPLDDPQHMELSIDLENMEPIKNDSQQHHMESEDEADSQGSDDIVAMVTDSSGAAWSASDVETFKKNIELF